MHWANDKYQLLLTSPSLCGQEMFQEIRDILESAADLAGKDDYEQQQEQSNASNGVQQSVATPSESSQSSIAASPRMDNVIGMDDLMAANNAGLEVFNQQQGHKAEAAMLMQAAIICQWARICEAELAIELLQCHGCSKALNSSMSVISSIQQSKLLLAPALFQEPSMPYVLETLSLAISAQSSALKPYIEHHSKLQHRIHEHEVQAIELNESNLQMQARLHQLQTQSAQLKAESSDQSNQLSLAQAANLDLSKKLTEYQQQQQQAEEDVEKWKHSCAQSKSQAERLQACYDDASKQLAQLSTDYEQLQASMTAKQTRWDETHKMMSDSISKLETALHDAVSRLRQLESEKAAEKATADELRSQLTVINAKLSEYTRLSETMFNLSRLPH
ncbi:hypothetical protein IWW36_002965 [Coemansia brasiliensis]|uniref:Uncharacterized protein n=1 Tax=Coemansia brasiliensis TaxID=2650707 RepID=A0A9W8LZ04_9FUNG|nr:hypothetical protein IWW36_002965 [Coemansia brasiliensis]